MIYRFGAFELDTGKMELREGGEPRRVEPQVFALLALLIDNRERMVSKDEIIEKIWEGRIVSDAAVASRIKSARAAVGDDGRAQRVIRTAHRQGVRFVAPVEELKPAVVAEPQPIAEAGKSDSRPSLAVLPFRLVGAKGSHATIADALPADLITDLSRLHWLLVIARPSSFRLRDAEGTLARARASFGVRYGLTGSVEFHGGRMIVTVELADTASEGVLWGERFPVAIDAVHEVREEIVRAVIGALETHIPLHEARLARLKPPGQLDAWSAYHLGLHHMFRFNRADNTTATALFSRAVELDPQFARAYAGLSFTHFQNAFLGYVADTNAAADLARRNAEICLERDPMDPFGNLTMGRSHWLNGDLEGSLAWLERAGTLNPNYAQARYSRGWTEALIGQSTESLANLDAALALSPLDPLRYGMIGARVFSLIALDDLGEAARAAERAATSPGAHALIAMIAVAAHGLNGNDARAKIWAHSARIRWPALSTAEFFRAFPFRDPDVRKRIAGALARFGF
ncbi:MAG: transcriptional regulator [Alphaproteobacteria bacterium]|nr:transcriptional regulator [Alphaproteobacteria bacterium]